MANGFLNGRDQISINECDNVVIASNEFKGQCRRSIYFGAGTNLQLAENSLQADAVFHNVGAGRELETMQ